MGEKDRSVLHLIEAVEAFISETEAALLEVEFGEAASQAVMEAYAVLRAMDLWGPKMRTRAMFIRSDSVVALGMAKKLSSPHSSLNFLAAEIVLRSCCAWRSSRFRRWRITTLEASGIRKPAGFPACGSEVMPLDPRAWQRCASDGPLCGTQVASG